MWLSLTLGACTSPDKAVTDARSMDFTAGWTFRLGDDTLAARPGYGATSISLMTGLLRATSVRTILRARVVVRCPVA